MAQALTLQEIFDRVAQHLMQQGQKSLTLDGDRCAYRDPRGLRCAAGILIPDDLYHPDMEKCRVLTDDELDGCLRSGDMVYYNEAKRICEALRAGGVRGEEAFKMVRQLQVVHDHFRPIGWRETLFAIADRYQLSTAVLNPAAVLTPTDCVGA